MESKDIKRREVHIAIPQGTSQAKIQAIQNTIKEIDKWSEGGVYRTALHTAMGLLAMGTVEGGLSAGTTAYTIPKIDEYLKEQGFDKEVRDTALLALSAGIGATVGGDTASTANNVGQV